MSKDLVCKNCGCTKFERVSLPSDTDSHTCTGCMEVIAAKSTTLVCTKCGCSITNRNEH